MCLPSKSRNEKFKKVQILFFLRYRARVKAGMKILGASASSDQWNISIEKENPKHTVARVTAFRKDQDPDSAAAASTKQGEATDSNK